jgi:hypothetical protein
MIQIRTAGIVLSQAAKVKQECGGASRAAFFNEKAAATETAAAA